MINTTIFQQAITLKVQPSEEDYLEYSRILVAAIINPRFCQMLLADPGGVLQNGYQDETFHLSDDGWIWLLSVRFATLSELASQLTPAFDMRPMKLIPFMTQHTEYPIQ